MDVFEGFNLDYVTLYFNLEIFKMESQSVNPNAEMK